MQFETHRLDNGLRVIFAPMRDVKSITATVFVGTGSRYETAEISGISHFLEHMLFKGTPERPTSLEISEVVDSVGGEFNAGTSKEYTMYYIKAASEHLHLSLDVLSDMLANSKLEAEEIENEKGVILEELKMYEDLPIRDVGDLYEGLLWGDQPLGWKTIGTRESVSATTREAMVNYKNRFYTLDNMIVGIGGNFDPQEVLGWIEQMFADFPETHEGDWVKAEEAQTEPQLLHHPKPTEQAHLVLGVRGVPRGDDDEYALKVMNVILGANMSSRLFIELRERQKLCYYVRSSVSSYNDTGSVEVQAGVDLSRITQATAGIMGELRKFIDQPVTEKELNKAKQYIRGKMALGLEDTEGLIDWLAMQQLLRGEIKSADQVFEEVDKVAAADVQAAAKRLFRDERLNLALIAPSDQVDQQGLKAALSFSA